MSLKSCIYQIVNIETNEKYIGSTKNFNSRKASHLYDLRKGIHRTQKLQSAFNKYGESSFAFLILEYVQTSRERLFEREQIWIDLLHPEYNENRTAGNVIPRSARTKEAKEKLSDAIQKLWEDGVYDHLKGAKRTFKAGHSPNKGKKLTLEQRKHLSEINKGKNNPNYGKKRSKEVRDKMAKTYSGVISPDGIIYPSIINMREFCREHNLDSGQMSRLMNGKAKSCKGWTRL